MSPDLDTNGFVLLVEDDEALRTYFRTCLEGRGWKVTEVLDGRLETACELLSSTQFDVVVLDLGLRDSDGLDTVRTVHARAPDVAIVVLTGSEGESFGMQAVRHGAQDYLLKGEVNASTLSRALRYAIERHGMQHVIQALAVTDELTGLHNRRGFLSLAEAQLQISRRNRQSVAVVFVDLDRLKEINDTQGHEVGDQAICGAAEVLRGAVRESDIVARLGGDEFAILLVNADPESERFIRHRIAERVREWNDAPQRAFELSLSSGFAHGRGESEVTVEELLRRADAAMYDEKQEKRRVRSDPPAQS